MRKIFTFLLMVAVHLNYAQMPNYVPTNGLQGYWPFTNNANDISGNNNNGTVSNAASTTDRFSMTSSAYAFDGSSSYISTNMTGILGNNARAVSFWAKSTNSTTTMCGVSWGFESVTAGVRYECGFNESGEGASIIGSNSAVTYSAPSKIYDNNWHHYIYQFAGGGTGELNQVEVYQDEVLLTTKTYSYQGTCVLNTANNWPVNFGRIPYSIPHYFQGSLDDIGIWTRTLTPCERHELFTSNKTTATISSPTTSICKGSSVLLTASGLITYTWNTSSNNANITVNPTVTTVYSVNGTGNAGCTAATSITITVIDCTGINEITADNSLVSVYPNPNNGNFSVRANSDIQLKIINALGQIISERKISAQTSMEINDLPPGIYFITDNSGQWRKKIIVNK